jgi:hypothetical protein
MLWIMLGCATARADDLVTRIDGAVERGRHWLIAQQSPDGAWRSHVYGLFKDGPSLTGHVAESLGKSAARDLAIQYLSGLAKDGEPGLIRLPLIYPVYTAADAVMLLPPGQENAAWLKFLREQQLDESLGWRETDLEFGGWS